MSRLQRHTLAALALAALAVACAGSQRTAGPAPTTEEDPAAVPAPAGPDCRVKLTPPESATAERIDLDGDGKHELVIWRAGGNDPAAMVRQDFDLDADGTPDRWDVYEQGKLARSTTVIPDAVAPPHSAPRRCPDQMMSYYEEGKLVRIALIVNGEVVQHITRE